VSAALALGYLAVLFLPRGGWTLAGVLAAVALVATGLTRRTATDGAD
jgi:hypothetical protein